MLDVIIRTQGNMLVLTIYGPQDHIDHYGYAMVTNVVSVNSSASYHEYGTSSTLAVTSGKVVIEETGVVLELKEQVYAANTALNIPTVEINNIITSTGNVLNSSVTSVQGTTSLEINNLAQLEAFRDATNSGENFYDEVNEKQITVNLNCDIYLKEAWKPISNYYRSYSKLSTYAFAGIFNGNGHTISGLTNKGLSSYDVNSGRNDSTPSNQNEVVYGFFASVYNATIKDIKFVNVNIIHFEDLLSDGVGALVGFTSGKTQISGIKVSGEISGYDAIGGIVGRSRGKSITIENCVNDANIFAYRTAAGIVAQLGGLDNGSNVSDSFVKKCQNNGSVTSDRENDINKPSTLEHSDNCRYLAYGIATHNAANIEIIDCSNTGTITNKNYITYNSYGCPVGQISNTKANESNCSRLGKTVGIDNLNSIIDVDPKD